MARANLRRDSGAARIPRQGFSLIELLLVLVIIVLLSTLFFGFASPNHQRIQQKNCAANLEKIFIALQIYANDNAGKFPALTNAVRSEQPLQSLVPRYSADTGIFVCPGSEDKSLPPGDPLTKHRISYAYYMGLHAGGVAPLMSDAQINTNSKAAGEQAFSVTGKPPGNNHHKYGGNVLFGDGRAELTKATLEFPLPITNGVVLLNPDR